MLILNLCQPCSRRLQPAPDGPDRCEAYPEGIPLVLLAGADHRTLRGDETGEAVAFDQLPGEPAAGQVAQWLKYGQGSM